MTPTLRWRPSSLAPILLASLLAPTAGAVVTPAVGSLEEARQGEAVSHLEGARFTFVTAIEAVRTAGDLEKLHAGTGIYLGTSADGRTGHVLTAAHIFHDPEVGGFEGVAGMRAEICFGPDRNRSGALRVAVREVFLHPDYSVTSRPEEKGAISSVTCRNDQLILAFDAAPCREALAAAGIQPAALFTAELPLDFTEALIVGFGQYGTVGGGQLHSLGRVHAGPTLVTLDEDRGFPVLLNGSLLDPKILAKVADPSSRKDGCRPIHCIPIKQPTWVVHSDGHKPMELRSHPRQSFHAAGDSGGPLLLKDEDGWKVVATTSMSHYFITSAPLTTDPRMGVFQIWHPVQPALAWIQAVKEGRARGTRLDQAAGAVAESKTPQTADRKRKAGGEPEAGPQPGGKRARSQEATAPSPASAGDLAPEGTAAPGLDGIPGEPAFTARPGAEGGLDHPAPVDTFRLDPGVLEDPAPGLKRAQDNPLPLRGDPDAIFIPPALDFPDLDL
jgi:hypothetical protein